MLACFPQQELSQLMKTLGIPVNSRELDIMVEEIDENGDGEVGVHARVRKRFQHQIESSRDRVVYQLSVLWITVAVLI